MARREYDDAWQIAFVALAEAAQKWRYPVVDHGLSSALSETLFSSVSSERDRVRAEMRDVAEALSPISRDVQELRRVLGARADEAPIPEAGWTRGWDREQPLWFLAENRRVELPDGSCVTFHGLSVIREPDHVRVAFDADLVPPRGKVASIAIRLLSSARIGIGPVWSRFAPGGGFEMWMSEAERNAAIAGAPELDRTLSHTEQVAAMLRVKAGPDPTHVGVYLSEVVLVVAPLT
jgi:hypothetical protein